MKSNVAAAQASNAKAYGATLDMWDPVSPDLRVVFDTQNGTGSGPASFSYMTHDDKAKLSAVKANADGRKGLNIYDDSMRSIDMKADAALTQLKKTMFLEQQQGKALGPHPLNLDKFMAFTMDGLKLQSTLAQAQLQRFAATPAQADLAFKFKEDPNSFGSKGMHLQAADMKMGGAIDPSWNETQFGTWWKSAYGKELGSVDLRVPTTLAPGGPAISVVPAGGFMPVSAPVGGLPVAPASGARPGG
jgi:hypothetical protein